MAGKADIRAVLRNAAPEELEELLRELRTCAYFHLRRKGWAAGRDEEPSRMSVDQAVNSAIERALRLNDWDPTQVDLLGYLRGMIRSVTSTERRSEVRAKSRFAGRAEELALPVDSPEDKMMDEEGERELRATVESCASGDADLEAFYLAVLDGNTKREAIAQALGWDPDRVSRARIKLQRRLVRAAPELFADVRERTRRGPA